MEGFNIKANKGEWSELYALFKLLGDGKLAAGDKDHQTIDNLIYPILEIIRMDNGHLFNYKNKGDVILITEDRKEISRIEVQKFRDIAFTLLNKIKESTDSSFEIPEIAEFREETFTSKIKADALEKADIYIVVHDPITSLTPKLGFSIKSELGAVPTLFNSGKNTNFIYRLSNRLNKSIVNEINTVKEFKKKITIINQHCTLEFIGIQPGKDGNLLYNNLVLIDSCMPSLLAHLLLSQYDNQSDTKLISKLTDNLKTKNPLGFDMSSNHPFYESKIKHFLTDVALGMTAGKKWDGIYQANGGYLVVKSSGDIVCYHIYNKKEFEDYLFFNTKLDTPSTSKFDFGHIEELEDGVQQFKLNLQIRFTK